MYKRKTVLFGSFKTVLFGPFKTVLFGSFTKNGYFSLPISIAIRSGLDLSDPTQRTQATRRSKELAVNCYHEIERICDNFQGTLFRVGGQIILDRHIQMLQKSGVHDIAVITGHLSDQVNSWLREHHLRVRSIFNELYYLDSMRSFQVGLDVSSKRNDPLIISGDRVYEEKLYGQMLEHAATTCLVIGPLSEKAKHKDSLSLNGNKIVDAEIESSHIYGGMTFIPKNFYWDISKQVDMLLKSLSSPWYFTLIASLVNNGFEIRAIQCHSDSALNINKPEQLDGGVPS